MTVRDRFEEDYAAALQNAETRHGGGGGGKIESVDSANSAPPWWLAFLFRHIGSQFAKHLAVLKKMRRSRPLPKTWQSFYPMLREAEWPIHVLLSEGARQILAGDPLNLRAVPFDPEPPSTFQPAFPRSALAMHQRIETTARFNADPEAYVRRHAARIAAREHDSDSDDSARAIPTIQDSRSGGRFWTLDSDDSRCRCPIAVAIRGPPWRGPTDATSTDLNPQTSPARMRPHD